MGRRARSVPAGPLARQAAPGPASDHDQCFTQADRRLAQSTVPRLADSEASHRLERIRVTMTLEARPGPGGGRRGRPGVSDSPALQRPGISALPRYHRLSVTGGGEGETIQSYKF